jgi:hypothetical protein
MKLSKALDVVWVSNPWISVKGGRKGICEGRSEKGIYEGRNEHNGGEVWTRGKEKGRSVGVIGEDRDFERKERDGRKRGGPMWEG